MNCKILLEHGYEFMKLYPLLSKRRLCEYFNISDRTLRKYKSMLHLNKKPYETWEKPKNHIPILVDICRGSEPYKTWAFENFEELNAWIYAQPHVCTLYVNDDNGVLRMHIKVQTGWDRKSDFDQIKKNVDMCIASQL